MEPTFNLEETAVIIDFDGTITDKDTNNLIFSRLGNEMNARIEQQFINDEIGTRESMERHFAQIRLTEQAYFQFIQKHVGIRRGFTEFLQNCMMHDIPVSVVSGGFENIIQRMLGQLGSNMAAYVDIFANRLQFQDEKIVPEFKHPFVNCIKEFGPCGNCKRSFVKDMQWQGYRIVFIGDGLTDRCGAELSDIVFARHKLANFCDNNQIPYVNYSDFAEINAHLFVEGDFTQGG